MKKIIIILVSFSILTSCETDFDNPNAPRVSEVIENVDGLSGLIVGLEHQYTVTAVSGLYNAISANGLTTGELQLLNAGNVNLAAIVNGGNNIAPNNTVITNLWTNLNLVRTNAQIISNNSTNAGSEDFASSIEAYGLLFEALAIGTMAQYWENVVVETGVDQVFIPREEGLQIALDRLSNALVLVRSNPIPSGLLGSIGNQIDLENSALALSARYSLMLGNLEEAIDFASEVDLSSSSVFVFDNVSQNPVFRSSLITENVYDVNPEFGLKGALIPDSDDQRIEFYLTANSDNGKGFFRSDDTSIPLYLPGEMLLIQAEAQARLNNLDSAIQNLNLVLTKNSDDDLFGVGASLPVYSGATNQNSILEEIFKNRAIELYMTGLKLEDSRRFGRPGPTDANPERNRNFYPYPSAERDNNPNTPPDPSI